MSYGNPLPKKPYPELLAQLAVAIPFLPTNDKTFALSLHDGHVKYAGWTVKQAMWAEKMVEKVKDLTITEAVTATDDTPAPTYVAMDLAQPGADLTAVAVAFGKVGEAAKVAAAGMAQLSAMLANAGKHLKQPAILLKVKQDVLLAPGCGYKVPTTIKVKKQKYGDGYAVTSGDGYFFYGFLSSEGVFAPKPKYMGTGIDFAVAETLKEFAADPVKMASSYGHLSGKCCFCAKGLTDSKSTSVGYGPVCASHYNLPWGHVSNGYSKGGVIKTHHSVPLMPPAQKTVVPAGWLKPLHQNPEAMAAAKVPAMVKPLISAHEFERLTRPVEYLF